MNWQVHTNIWGRLAPLADGWSPAEKRINRIYYIHGGEGYYEIDGTTYPFEHNKLYILPDTVLILVSQSYDDPMDHTFFDFEMIPGFSFHHVIGIDVDQYPMIKAQMDVFQKLIDC